MHVFDTSYAQTLLASRIGPRIVVVEGGDADHKTTATAMANKPLVSTHLTLAIISKLVQL